MIYVIFALMKQAMILFLGCILSCTAFTQKNIKIFSIKEQGRTVLCMQNNEMCPVSVVLKLSLRNMKSSEAPDRIYVIPKTKDKVRLTVLTTIKQRVKAGYSYSYTAYFGNINQVDFDEDYEYDLPYKTDDKYRIEQGYDGKDTHQNENALDFDMPEGTEVLAAREGVVVDVVESNIGSCFSEECRWKANYVLIYHPDGTFADYAHLKYNGAMVKVGDFVQKGDLIGFSGKTGFAKGPHLHFVCFIPGVYSRQTLATKFRTGDGSNAEYLKEGRTYKKRYD